MCSKEWRKTFVKKKKSSNDLFVKMKKLNKDIAAFLKRKNKEINEIRRKREKIENEVLKIEKEKREERKQKRKIEFLIKQSGIYAEFMASKLGLNHNKHKMNSLINLTKEENSQARDNVKTLIQQDRDKKHQYDKLKNESQGLDFSQVQISKNSRLVNTPKSFIGVLKSY